MVSRIEFPAASAATSLLPGLSAMGRLSEIGL
jgi:hypothetical protein